jgi:hypothetical protein
MLIWHDQAVSETLVVAFAVVMQNGPIALS